MWLQERVANWLTFMQVQSHEDAWWSVTPAIGSIEKTHDSSLWLAFLSGMLPFIHRVSDSLVGIYLQRQTVI